MNKDAKITTDTNKILIKRIFTSCTSGMWDSVIQLIKNDKCDFTDYNTKDGKGYTIMNYLIENGKADILQLLLSKPNVAIDVAITATKAVTVFHSIIKNNQIDILKILLHFNNKLIGKNILDIADSKGRTAIFYAVELENKECVELIQKYYFNIYNKDATGNNVMHYLITTRDDVAILKSLKFNNNYNTTNEDGETPLHLAIKWKRMNIIKYLLATDSCNLDVVENKYEFSILHYCCIMFDPAIFALFAGYIEEMDNNTQDRFGKTPYFYFLNGYKNAENNNKSATATNKFNKLILQNFDYNLFDINGDTVCHFALKQKIADECNGVELVANLVKNTNLNTPNFIGETCLFLLVKNNLWKTYKNILETKKLDLFIITAKKGKTIMEHVRTTDKDEFIQMVANSYLFQLTKNKNGWIDKWDKKCANYKGLAKLTDKERNELSQHGISSSGNGKQICTSLIINSIKQSKSSYPISSAENTIQISIENYPSVSSNNIYIGSTLEVLCGLIHLKNKFSTNMSYWINNVREIVKCNRVGMCDATGFSARWANGKLYDLRMGSEAINALCGDGITRFFILPLSIDVVISNSPFHHLNYLIFDTELKEVERFEPHGSASPSGFDYHATSLDNVISHEVAKRGYKYFSPSTFLPKIGFQVREMNEEGLLPLSDPDGFCSLWCVWWCEMRMMYKDVSRDKLVKLLFKEIASSGISLKTMIRNYGYFVSAIRDKLLDEAGIEFGVWKNDEMDEKQVKELNRELEKVVTKNV
jgi:ankyrin repeat protein